MPQRLAAAAADRGAGDQGHGPGLARRPHAGHPRGARREDAAAGRAHRRRGGAGAERRSRARRPSPPPAASATSGSSRRRVGCSGGPARSGSTAGRRRTWRSPRADRPQAAPWSRPVHRAGVAVVPAQPRGDPRGLAAGAGRGGGRWWLGRTPPRGGRRGRPRAARAVRLLPRAGRPAVPRLQRGRAHGIRRSVAGRTSCASSRRPSGMPSCWAGARFEGALQQAVTAYKDEDRRDLRGPLAALLAAALGTAVSADPVLRRRRALGERRARRAPAVGAGVAASPWGRPGGRPRGGGRRPTWGDGLRAGRRPWRTPGPWPTRRTSTVVPVRPTSPGRWSCARLCGRWFRVPPACSSTTS